MIGNARVGGYKNNRRIENSGSKKGGDRISPASLKLQNLDLTAPFSLGFGSCAEAKGEDTF